MAFPLLTLTWYLVAVQPNENNPQYQSIFLTPKLKSCQISTKEFFMRIVNYFYPLTIFAKKLHRRCLGGLKYVFGLHDFFISNAFFQLSLSVT